jgi:hypothetical protein
VPGRLFNINATTQGGRETLSPSASLRTIPMAGRGRELLAMAKLNSQCLFWENNHFFLLFLLTIRPPCGGSFNHFFFLELLFLFLVFRFFFLSVYSNTEQSPERETENFIFLYLLKTTTDETIDSNIFLYR